jgi:glycosyltransferase involved in cell wall biosynthesis
VFDSRFPITISLLNLNEGGAQRAMVNFANICSKNGHVVRMMLCNSQGNYINDVDKSVKIEEIGPSFVRMIFKLFLEFRENKSPVLLATQIKPIIACCIAKFLAKTETRLVLRPANRLNMGYMNLKHCIANILTPFCYRQADYFIALSEAIADDLVELGVNRSKIKIITNGVDVNNISKKCEEIIYDTWFISDSTPLIIAVGRLSWQKGFDNLIRAMKIVEGYRPDVKLIILGEGELRDDLQNLILSLDLKDVINLPGYVDNPYKYLAASRVFVLPSRWEGSPNALLEALACGCNVIAADCPSGPREIIISDQVGKLVPVDNVDELASAILQKLDEKLDKKSKISFISNKFGIDAWAKRYIGVLSTPN